jgi:taurine transport system substrate-binding protein
MHLHSNVRAIGAAAAAVALSVSLSGCVESDRPESATGGDSDCPWEADTSIDTEARIGYQNVPNVDVIVKDLGILEACMPNASIQWSNFPSGGDVVQAFGGKGLDLGLAGSSPSVIALSPSLELPVSVVWIHDVIGAAEALVVKDEAVKDITDLEGATIGVPFGSTTHYSLLQALNDAGMDASKDVKVINLQPEAMPAAWQGDQLDAAWVWNPTLASLQESGGHIVLTSADTAEAGKPTFDLGLASNAFLKANPDFMTQWAKAEDYAVSLLNDDPDKAAESIAVVMSLKSVDDAKALLDGLTYLPASEQASPDWLGGKLGKDLFSTAQFLLQQGGIDKVLPMQAYEASVDATPAEEASQG